MLSIDQIKAVMAKYKPVDGVPLPFGLTSATLPVITAPSADPLRRTREPPRIELSTPLPPLPSLPNESQDTLPSRDLPSIPALPLPPATKAKEEPILPPRPDSRGTPKNTESKDGGKVKESVRVKEVGSQELKEGSSKASLESSVKPVGIVGVARRPSQSPLDTPRTENYKNIALAIYSYVMNGNLGEAVKTIQEQIIDKGPDARKRPSIDQQMQEKGIVLPPISLDQQGDKVHYSVVDAAASARSIAVPDVYLDPMPAYPSVVINSNEEEMEGLKEDKAKLEGVIRDMVTKNEYLVQQ